MANEQNLRPYRKGEISSEEAKKRGSKGGRAYAENLKLKATLSEIVKNWAEQPVSERNKQALQALGVEETNYTQKATLLIPIMREVRDGNMKATQMLIELLSEDKEKQARIRKLEAETERLKAETERLKAENERLQNGGTDYEDLTPLSELIKIEDEDSDD